MSCDFESLYYNVKQELLDLFREAEKPIPRVKMRDLRSARLCGLVNLAKMVLYLEALGIVVIVNKDEHHQSWEIDIQPQVLDILFEQI